MQVLNNSIACLVFHEVPTNKTICADKQYLMINLAIEIFTVTYLSNALVKSWIYKGFLKFDDSILSCGREIIRAAMI